MAERTLINRKIFVKADYETSVEILKTLKAASKKDKLTKELEAGDGFYYLLDPKTIYLFRYEDNIIYREVYKLN